jgi:hypothetical protein
MNLNGFDILGNGNISISGNVTANEVIGTFNGSFNGSFNGTLVGNVLVTDGTIIVQAVDSSTNNFNPVSINGLTFSGSNLFDPGINVISTAIGDGLVILSDNQLVLNSPNGVLIDTDLTVTNGIVGTISSISNHNLSGLGDVADTQPNNGQALVWNGTAWAPGNVATSGQEINTFDLGNFRRVFTNPLVYLLDRVGIDFGTFTEPSDFTIDLETF